MSMCTTNLRNSRYIDLIQLHLGSKPNMLAPLNYLQETPEIIDIHVGELIAAINRLHHWQEKGDVLDQRLCKNANYLVKHLNGELLLPEWDELNQLIVNTTPSGTTTLHQIIEEISTTYEFIDREKNIFCLLGTLFIAFYRTYTLITRPLLREANVQVGSSIEEMLSLLAIDGCSTLLFRAVKQWVVDYENEGFSKELAVLINDL